MKLLLFSILALFLSACTSSPQWEAVVKNRFVEGASIDGQCAVYVSNLQAKLNFPTEKITFTARCNEPIPKIVRHQLLAYSVGNESWFIDNLICRPRWVGSVNDPLEQRIQQFYSPIWVYPSDIVVDKSK